MAGGAIELDLSHLWIPAQGPEWRLCKGLQRRESTAPKSSFPRRRESTQGAGDGFPSPPERRAAAAHPQSSFHDGRRQAHPRSSFPRRRESTAGGRRWVSLSTGTTVGGGAPQSSFPRRRESTEGARRWVPLSTGTTVGGGAPQSSFPRRRESTVGGRRWVPLSTGTTAGGGRTHNRHSRDGGNPQRGGRRWVPVSTGTTAGGGRTQFVIPATEGIHGGAGDGFPSTRERRWAAAHTQSSSPRRRESTEGGRVPLSSSEQVPRRAGPRAASNVRYNDERRHRPPVDATAARGPDARWIDAAGGATDVSELR